MTISPTGSIVMIVVLSILALLFITELTKTLRKRPSRISPTAIIFLMVSSVLLVYLFYAGQDMGLVDYSQILLMLGLVAITSLYATSTEKQAKTSIEMAEEMRQQRNDMVRPVIDIERDTWNDDMISEALTISDNNTSLGLHFKLSNVGIGPALDVETITQFGDRRQLQSLGTIAKDGDPSLELISRTTRWTYSRGC